MDPKRQISFPPGSLPRESARPCVAVSTVANQYYCEMQVHLGVKHDLDLHSEAMEQGSSGHAEVEAEAEEVSREEIARRLAAGEALSLVEVPLSAEREGLTLLGRADRVELTGFEARLVLELKFSAQKKLYLSHVVQVQSYGLLLSACGLDTHRLVHAVAVLPRGEAPPEGLGDRLAKRALREAERLRGAIHSPDPWTGVVTRTVREGPVTLHLFLHDPEQAERRLSWALEYWKGARSPARNASPPRCRVCPFNAARLCPEAKALPDERYQARRVESKEGGKALLRLTTR